jgi:hypothetical protein
VSRRALCWLVPVGLLAVPAPAPAAPLDVPAAVPAKFRSLVRAELSSKSSQRHSWESRVYLHSQHGYELALVGQGNVVVLQVLRRRRSDTRDGGPLSRGRAVTAYVARGRVSSRRIEASFKGLGSVALRFRPARRNGRVGLPRHCRGGHRFARRGVFVGHLRFTGEDGYVAIRAHRAKGWTRQASRVRCHRHRHHHHRHRPRIERRKAVDRPVAGSRPLSYTALTAEWRHVVASTGLLAIRVRERTLVLALAEESLGSLAKVRYAVSVTGPSALVHDDALTSAKVRPPAPFDGMGLYRAAPDGARTWTGSLSVAFPGAHVPLTGSQFDARLRVGL